MIVARLQLGMQQQKNTTTSVLATNNGVGKFNHYHKTVINNRLQYNILAPRAIFKLNIKLLKSSGPTHQLRTFGQTLCDICERTVVRVNHSISSEC